MMGYRSFMTGFCVAVLFALALVAARPSQAASAAELNRDAKVALQKLYTKSPHAKALAEKATAILVFPA
ncbi:MAG: twin-arginine translocation pathway signal protein, partial [Bryobacteraceae bacterium]